MWSPFQACKAALASSKGGAAQQTNSSDEYITVLSNDSFRLSSTAAGNPEKDSTFMHCPNLDKDLQ